MCCDETSVTMFCEYCCDVFTISVVNIIDKHHVMIMMSLLWEINKINLQNFTKFYEILRKSTPSYFCPLCWTQWLMQKQKIFFQHDAKHTDITLIFRVIDGCNSQGAWGIDDSWLLSCIEITHVCKVSIVTCLQFYKHNGSMAHNCLHDDDENIRLNNVQHQFEKSILNPKS